MLPMDDPDAAWGLRRMTTELVVRTARSVLLGPPAFGKQ